MDQAKLYLNVFVVTPGTLVSTPFTDEDQLWCATVDPRSTLTCQSSTVIFCRPLAAKKLPFYCLRHFVVSPVGGDLRKLNTGAQLQAFPYPTISIHHGEIGRTNSDVHKCDGQTNKETNYKL